MVMDLYLRDLCVGFIAIGVTQCCCVGKRDERSQSCEYQPHENTLQVTASKTEIGMNCSPLVFKSEIVTLLHGLKKDVFFLSKCNSQTVQFDCLVPVN